MLQAVPKGMMSYNYEIIMDGEKIVDIDRSWFTESGTVTIEGIAYKAYRESALGDFVLAHDNVILARAKKAWSDKFDFHYNGRNYTLKGHTFSRNFALVTQNEVVGTITAKNAFSRKAKVNLPEDFSLPMQIFILWLVLVIWYRQDAAAAGGA